MKHPATLLEKFFRGECNEAENQVVREYLIQHPEALQPWLTEESWHSFHPESLLPTDISEKMLAAIESRTYRKMPPAGRSYKWLAVAAAIAIPALAGVWWMQQHPVPIKQHLGAPPVTTHSAITPVFAQQVNRTSKTMRLRLNDGSTVALAPQSQIRYEEPFATHNRSIHLSGTALFNVAANREKPFTVYAGNYGTTALGTVFRITTLNSKKGVIRVQLISGKVVVKADSLLGNKGIKATYLLPGQALCFDQQGMVPVTNNNQQAPVKTENEIFNFRNEPLANIFRLMSEKFHVKIQYQESTLADMSFTGVFDSSKESLADFLGTISTLNNLTIKQTNETIYITQ
ncbi:FecR family protein [Chitinophaga polysaccharea]|uniref:FecR family protein n=1 Tax=Chitinophaga polysaccharea TaxID=1293035 RepID=A0A561P6W4_9BACT|nr:FecR family protein [Chitinophaga polysaccharea]TWF33848.1 FecR family protein [Chitinophaga polysaccharea]